MHRSPLCTLAITTLLSAFAIRATAQESGERQHLEALRARAQRFVDDCVASRELPGMGVGLVLPDGAGVAVVAGHEDLARERPLTTAHRFLSGSIGKTYVAAVVLQLVEEGRLSLDGRLRDVLGDAEWYQRLPNAETITLRHLLHHQSGLPDHVWAEGFAERLLARPDDPPGPTECVGYVLDVEPLSAPGGKWLYADTNYVLLGLVVEKVTGKGCFAVITERLLQPLALEETRPSNRRSLPMLANGHACGMAFTKGDTVVDGRYFVDPAFEYCGGGMCSTPLDLARWGHALFAGAVIPAALRDAHRDGVPSDPRVTERYGLGCFDLDSAHGRAFGHSGFMPGFQSVMVHYPDCGTVALMWNTDDSRKIGNVRRLADQLLTALGLAPRPRDRAGK